MEEKASRKERKKEVVEVRRGPVETHIPLQLPCGGAGSCLCLGPSSPPHPTLWPPLPLPLPGVVVEPHRQPDASPSLSPQEEENGAEEEEEETAEDGEEEDEGEEEGRPGAGEAGLQRNRVRVGLKTCSRAEGDHRGSVPELPALPQ